MDQVCEANRGWYSRGYLPHLDVSGRSQFITWRLADSVPAELIRRWKHELAMEPESKRKLELYSRIEKYLDLGHGSCILRNPVAASIVQDALLFHHRELYQLHEWTVMPNHVHVLLTPHEEVSLERLVHANKSYTSSRINRALGLKGRLWEPEYFDRLVRDEAHFSKIAHYIRRNPVKAKLCTDFRFWSHGSGNPESKQRLLQEAGREVRR